MSPCTSSVIILHADGSTSAACYCTFDREIATGRVVGLALNPRTTKTVAIALARAIVRRCGRATVAIATSIIKAGRQHWSETERLAVCGALRHATTKLSAPPELAELTSILGFSAVVSTPDRSLN